MGGAGTVGGRFRRADDDGSLPASSACSQDGQKVAPAGWTRWRGSRRAPDRMSWDPDADRLSIACPGKQEFKKIRKIGIYT
jgi:hypothetical protein